MTVDTPGDLVTLNYTWVSEGRTQFGPQATFVWTEPGRHMVVLTVTDDDGDIDELFLPVDVENQVPTGQAVVDRTEAKVGETLSFSAVDISDTPSDLPKLTVTWEFGDGALALGEAVTHEYEEGGSFIVKMIVKDNNGDQAEYFIPVTIEAESGGLAGGSSMVLVAIAVVAVLAVIGALLFLRGRTKESPSEDLGIPHEDDVIAENGDGTSDTGEDADDAGPATLEDDPPTEAGADGSESTKYEENA